MAQIEPKRMHVNGAELVLRTASEADAEAVVLCRKRVVGTSPFLIGELQDVPPVEKVRTTFAEQAEDESQLSIVAEVVSHSGGASALGAPGSPGEIIATLSFKGGNRRKIAHQGAFGIGVDEAWRGMGVGTAMIEMLLDWAAAHPVIEKVALGVFETNRKALRLYKKIGFVEEGRQVRFFKEGPGEYADDVLMCIFVKEGVAPSGFGLWRGGGTSAPLAGRGAQPVRADRAL